MTFISLKTAKRELKLDAVDDFTNRRVRKMQVAFNALRDRHSFISRYPLKTVPVLEEVLDKKGKPTGQVRDTGEVRTETAAEWEIRIIQTVGKEQAKHEDETQEEYVARLFKFEVRDHLSEYCFEFINELCGIFSIELLTEEEFDDLSLERCREFCEKCLKAGAVQDRDELFFRGRLDIERAAD